METTIIKGGVWVFFLFCRQTLYKKIIKTYQMQTKMIIWPCTFQSCGTPYISSAFRIQKTPVTCHQLITFHTEA